MKAILLLVALLTILPGDRVGFIEEQEIGVGVLLGAVTFENGDSAVITVEKHPHSHLPVLGIVYQGDGVFERRYSNVLPDHRAPDLVIVEACGGFLQIHAGWEGEFGNVVMKYRFAPPGSENQIYLPVVCGERQVLEIGY